MVTCWGKKSCGRRGARRTTRTGSIGTWTCEDDVPKAPGFGSGDIMVLIQSALGLAALLCRQVSAILIEIPGLRIDASVVVGDLKWCNVEDQGQHRSSGGQASDWGKQACPTCNKAPME